MRWISPAAPITTKSSPGKEVAPMMAPANHIDVRRFATPAQPGQTPERDPTPGGDGGRGRNPATTVDLSEIDCSRVRRSLAGFPIRIFRGNRNARRALSSRRSRKAAPPAPGDPSLEEVGQRDPRVAPWGSRRGPTGARRKGGHRSTAGNPPRRSRRDRAPGAYFEGRPDSGPVHDPVAQPVRDSV
jgi:hypothetical protein